MKVIIVEDEIVATRKLESLLGRVKPGTEILARLESVKETVKWIKQDGKADLAFFDIQLADDVSFEIFKQCRVTFPVIFVTAYDSYLMQAFEQNTIHYLLKPITEEKLREALKKLDRLAEHFTGPWKPDERADEKDKLLVRKGLDVVPIDIAKIAYIFCEHKLSFAKDKQGVIYLVDQSLMDLEKTLGPKNFFRANRQYLVNLEAIEKYRSVDQGKIRLELKPAAGEEVIIGKENAGWFRKWIKEMV